MCEGVCPTVGLLSAGESNCAVMSRGCWSLTPIPASVGFPQGARSPVGKLAQFPQAPIPRPQLPGGHRASACLRLCASGLLAPCFSGWFRISPQADVFSFSLRSCQLLPGWAQTWYCFIQAYACDWWVGVGVWGMGQTSSIECMCVSS